MRDLRAFDSAGCFNGLISLKQTAHRGFGQGEKGSLKNDAYFTRLDTLSVPCN